jgi:predicted ATPase/DNA-binding XRE family transcriptional regulator
MGSNDGPGAFGVQLQRHRLAAGLSQEELALRAGLSRRGIADLERGARRAPHPGTVRRLAEALELSEQDRLALRTAAMPSEGMPAVTGWSGLSELPVKASSFVGRQHELTELGRQLAVGRLLSLVGPGGIGKTRLALEVVRVAANRYVAGVVFVDLAPLTRPEHVVDAVARAVGLRIELDREPYAAIVSFLAARELLLVLDNCEHMVEACAELVTALLQNCPGVTVLATSREPLEVDGESLWRLGPLDEATAARLFIDRAQARRPEFDSEDGVTVRQVCLALDCLPLAIELAAARVTVLTPAEILPLLKNRLALLGAGGRGRPARQRTLRATIDWSYDLLEPAERQLFRRLAVFVGSFDLAGATKLAGSGALDVLGRLVDKSLVVTHVTQSGTRYRLLDTLRYYAWDQLQHAGEVELARRLHVDYFVRRAEALFSPTDSVDGPSRELDAELDNLRTALEWCLESDPQAGLRLIGLTRDVWWRRSFAEGRRWSREFLDRCPEPSVARAQALTTAGTVEVLGHPAEARRLLSEARALAVHLDPATLAAVDYRLGIASFSEEDVDDAIQHLEHALSTMSELADQRGSMRIHVGLGWALLTETTRREEGRVRLERAFERATELGDRHSAGAADFGLGLYWRWTGILCAPSPISAVPCSRCAAWRSSRQSP